MCRLRIRLYLPGLHTGMEVEEKEDLPYSLCLDSSQHIWLVPQVVLFLPYFQWLPPVLFAVVLVVVGFGAVAVVAAVVVAVPAFDVAAVSSNILYYRTELHSSWQLWLQTLDLIQT